MNWLAHLLLSDPRPACRIGGLLPDLLSAQELAGVSAEFQSGIQRHQKIDVFTDSHPVFRKSVARFVPPYRRFGGILVDVFYDHFIARDWSKFCSVPLSDFNRSFYTSLETHQALLPPLAYQRLCEIRTGGWLDSYGELQGLEEALRRISFRLRKHFDLAGALPVLQQQYEGFAADFAEFIEDLVRQVMPGGKLPSVD